MYGTGLVNVLFLAKEEKTLAMFYLVNEFIFQNVQK